MAIGKNKKVKKKKGAKKGADPFQKKEWYDVRAPNIFTKKDVGKTFATRTIGKKQAKDSLLGRVIEVSLGDLKPSGEDDAFRKFKLKVEAVQGLQCLTNFYGMSLATDKLRSLVRKWHSLIEAHADVKTSDGYVLRIFVIAFTKKRQNQHKKTSYAQSSQIKKIRKKMIEIIQREASTVVLAELVKKFIPESIGQAIETATQGIYPLQTVFIRKVKMLKGPKTDIAKLLELHSGTPDEDVGQPVDRPDDAFDAGSGGGGGGEEFQED